MAEHAHVSWDQFHRDCKTLALTLAAKLDGVRDGKGWEAVVAITRGGLIPAGIVSRELDLRFIETLCIATYTDGNDLGQLNVIKPLSDRVMQMGDEGSHVLVIDDLVDSGTTLREVRRLLPRAHIATVYAKPKAADLVDTYARDVPQDQWINFPWDLTLAFAEPIRGKG